MIRTASWLLAAVLALAPLAAAAAPGTVSFTARMADNGRPVTGAHNFTFKIFDADTAGNELWKWSATDTPTSLTVNDGVVSYALGSENPFDLGALAVPGAWLEVTVDGVAMTPRMEIHAVPWALWAVVAPTTSFAPTGGATTTVTGGSGVCVNVASVTITTPAAGRVVVEGRSWVYWSHTAGAAAYVYSMIGQTASDCTNYESTTLMYKQAEPSGFYYEHGAPRWTFQVPSAGTYTYYYNAFGYGTPSKFLTYSNLSATYFP